jgi:hypothetical protein
MRRLRRVSVAAQCVALWLSSLLVTSCGGGGGGGGGGESNQPPLWVSTDVVVADVDRDLRADVLTLAMYSTGYQHREGRLSVYRQTSAGTFAAPDVYAVGVYPWRFRVADIDGDGLPDIAISDSDAQQLLWMRQDPANPGHFKAPVVIASGVGLSDIAVGDLNNDSAPDLLIAECMLNANRVLEFEQDPSRRGTFRAPRTVAAPAPVCGLGVADVDGDGLDDIVGWFATDSLTASAPGTGELAVLWQAADGSFAQVTIVATRNGVNARRTLVADYAGDGTASPIVYLTPAESGYEPEVITALHAPGSRVFTQVMSTPLPGLQGVDDAAFADLDGDSRLDGVVAGFFPVGNPSQVYSNANQLRQIGDGTLMPVATYSLSISASRVDIGDLDGDGRADIVLFGDNRVVRMLQSKSSRGHFGAPAPLR